MTAVSSGVERREFLRRAGMLGVGLSLPSGLLAACGSDAGSSAGTTGGGTRGGVLSIGATDWLPPDFFLGNSLGPWLLGMSQMAWGLFRGGGGNGRGFELQNGLASGYEVSPDGLVHTVRLRRGMVFHDGSPIDADAVVANLNAAFFARDPLRDRGTYVQVIITLGSPPIVKRVDAVDPHTVRITLTEARVDIRVALAFLLIFNPKVLANKDYGTDVQALRDAGSGPFRLTNWQAKSFMELERFDGFFEDVLPDRVRLQGIPDAGALALAVRGGEVAVASGLAKTDFDSLSRSGHRIVASDPAVNVDLVLSRPKDPIFEDERVRRAMLLAMDRQAYTDRFFNTGTAKISSEPIIVDGIPGFVPGLQVAPHDVSAARALMAQAGAKSPKLTLAGPIAQAPVSDWKAMLEAIAADLGTIGIDASVDIQDPTAFGDALDHGRVEAFVSAPGGQADPFILFDLFYRGGSYAPGALHTVPAVTRELEAAHKAKTADARDQHLQEVMKLTVEHQLVLPISWVGYSVLANEKVTGFQITCTQLDSFHRVSVST